MVAGGMESMSNVPVYTSRQSPIYGNRTIFVSIMCIVYAACEVHTLFGSCGVVRNYSGKMLLLRDAVLKFIKCLLSIPNCILNCLLSILCIKCILYNVYLYLSLYTAECISYDLYR